MASIMIFPYAPLSGGVGACTRPVPGLMPCGGKPPEIEERSLMRNASTKSALLVLAGSACIATASMADIVVYSQNFNGPLGSEWSGGTSTESVQGLSGLGNPGRTFSGNLLRNANSGNPAAFSELTLTGLAAHTTISVGFLLAIIDSWDGNTSGQFRPDFFNITLDGNSIFSYSFANAVSGWNGNYTAPTNGLIAGSATPGGAGAANFGWGAREFDNDSAFDMYLENALQNIAHTGSTATFRFFASGGGWQGGMDESWGIDNLQISTNAAIVPLPPAALAGLSALAGVAGIGAIRRRSLKKN
jgi:hypothetical protein